MDDLKYLLAELTRGDEVHAEAAVPKLISLGEDALPALRGLLRSQDADHRWWAIRTLAASPQPRTEDLLPFLDDSAPEVRQAAALGLCSHPAETAVSPLVRALNDDDSMTAGLACAALVKIGAAAVPSLLDSLKDASQAARIQAIRALAEIADPRAIQALLAALEEDSVILQHWAEEGLDRLGLNMVYLRPE